MSSNSQKVTFKRHSQNSDWSDYKTNYLPAFNKSNQNKNKVCSATVYLLALSDFLDNQKKGNDVGVKGSYVALYIIFPNILIFWATENKLFHN